MSIYTITPLPTLVAGIGALCALPEQLHRLHARALLLISDQGMAAAGWAGRVHDLLADRYPVDTFLAPPGEPCIATVDAGVTAARILGTGVAVVGLGGGTALDIAKLVAAVSAGTRPMQDYMMCANPYAGKLPSLMIPSTSGTGAEVTRTCVVTDVDGRKSWAWGDELCPDVALLDPEITVTLPPTLTAATGIDAFVHAVEAATAQRVNAIVEGYALQAIRLICTALATAVAEPHDLKARQQMQEAACLAGIAINQCGTGIAHNIGHALGTVAHLPHAIAVAIAMERSLAWSVDADPGRYQAVASAMRPGTSGNDVPHLFMELLEAADFDRAARPYHGTKVGYAGLLDSMLSAENLPMMANNARVPTQDEMGYLASRVVAGWPQGSL